MMSSAVANHQGLKAFFGDFSVQETMKLPKEAFNQQQFAATGAVISIALMENSVRLLPPQCVFSRLHREKQGRRLMM